MAKTTAATVTEPAAPVIPGKLSGEKTTVYLYYDGERYNDPLFVQINGMTWLVQRGEPVEVPVEVAAVINQQIQQDRKTADLKRKLAAQAKEMQM